MATETARVATAADLERLRNSVHGPVIGPEDEGYDEARSIWNGAIDRRPAFIAGCTGVADVVAAVGFARERDLLVGVRSGGHGVGGHALCDGGLVIDLSPMKGIRVDPATRTARAEAGVLWGELDRETQLHGLATVGGIVTSFEYRLHPVGPIVLAGPIFHPLEDAREVLAFYREFIAAAPDELTTIFELSVAPPLPFLPEEVHGQPIVMVGACYAGSPDEGAEVVRSLKEFGRPIGDLLEPKPYTALQSMFDPMVPHGWHRYWKSVELPPLTDEAIDTLVEHAPEPTSPKSYCIVFQLGGALDRVGAGDTAYGQRDVAHNVNVNAVWTEDDPEPERHIAWARDFFDALQPHTSGRVYVNFLGDEGQDRVRAAYGERNYERLVELKRAYDPTNFFRLNQNIQPG